jgi:O-antigen/teichoic acid export membrane protein
MAIRMLISMATSLYTSRVVLQQLGIVDFGIYAVVGGLTMVMSFFTNALTTAIQRYMNVELGTNGGKDINLVFSASWLCVIAMTAIFLILAEGVGLWFLNNQLSIPPGRMADAQTVFQMSMVIVIFEMLRVPYSSLIISYEQMSFYAYNSIIESMLKLITVFLLSLVGGSKLLAYMAFLIGVAFVVNISYMWFCKHTHPTIRYSRHVSYSQVKEISKFAGWNVLSSLSDISYMHGSSLILNMFFGVTLNATMGVANQVRTAVTAFTKGVQTAANPQIIQSYANGDHKAFTGLFTTISRIACYLIIFIGTPILINTNLVLNTWLATLPPHAIVFVRLMIVFCIVDSLTGPLWVTMQACGKIAVYQIVISTAWLINLPITYIGYRAGMPHYWLLVVMIVFSAVITVIRLLFTRANCNISLRTYLREVIRPIAATTLIAYLVIFPTLLIHLNPWPQFLLTTGAWLIVFPATLWCVGITSAERTTIKAKLAARFHRS